MLGYMVMNFDKKMLPQILYMMYIVIVIQPQSYHTTRQISIAYSGLKQK
jgi:hypothetical protein